MASRFASVTPVQSVEVAGLRRTFMNDASHEKVNLIIGAYRDEKGEPWVFPVVQKTEIKLVNEGKPHHEYLPFLGSNEFKTASMILLLGRNSIALKERRVLGVQTVGGSGALAIGARFLVQQLKAKHFYYSNPCWPGHEAIFLDAGFKTGIPFRYWHARKRGIDMDGLLEDLSRAEENSVVVLHARAHNPTGCDPTREQWVQIANLMKKKNLLPFFDSAYQGIATGDVDEDAAAVRYFVDQGFEFMCSQSFSKNFGLYGHRAANLTFVVNDASTIPAIESQMEDIIQKLNRSPPRHGSDIVSTILNDEALNIEWRSNLKILNGRLKDMRIGLRERLEKLKTPGSWEHITSQIGMFTYTGLTPQQMEYLRLKHHVYALSSGRINIGGLNLKNLDHVATSIHDTVVRGPDSPIAT